MIAAAVTFYNVVVWLHISAVVLAFGPTFAYGIFIALARRKTTPAACRRSSASCSGSTARWSRSARS